MKTKKGLKRIVALIMCVVLLATSLPIALAANGAYNPAPYFTQDAQEKGASAWLDEEGNLQIRFPAAVGCPTHAVWSKNPNETVDVKAIDYYIVEVSDLGGKLEKHNTQPPVLMSKKVWASDIMAMAEGDTLYTVFTADEIGTLLNEDNRYNVAITAVDEAGWFSLALNALISDVPEFYFDMDKFEVLSEDAYAMREMMRFESGGDYTGYQQTGNMIDLGERVSNTGAPDQTTNIKTTGYRVHLSGRPGEGGQTIDTPESRQTWDFKGADEVWYWMDLSEVRLQGVSFRLRANYKRIDYNLRNASIDNTQHYGEMVYSTLGTKHNTYAEGEEPYVLVQNANGNWEKVLMQNGTINLGHFKGYVRIPIQFFCSEKDSEVDTHNIVFGQTKSSSAPNDFYDNEVCIGSHQYEDANTTTFYEHATIDPAGTPIADALLLQQGRMYYRPVIGGDRYSYDLGTFLAPGITDADIVKAADANPRRASLVKDENGVWTVKDRDTADYYTALEDIYSAGVAYDGISADSVNKSFFLDNIMFYRTDGEAWTEATIGNDPNLTKGTKVSTYFDQRTDAQDRILDAIEKYIGSPSWSDYRGVTYVTNMINTYFEAYKSVMGEQYAKQFLSTAALKGRAEKIGRLETWQNYIDAQKLCQEAGVLESNNSMPNDLVPMLVRSLEALPDPLQITGISDTLRDEVIKLYQAYICLNYGQLKMFGSYIAKDADGNVTALYEEEKLLQYVSLLGDQLDDHTVTGYKLANYPYLVFNDFEKNTKIGDRVWRLEDDVNYTSSNFISDYSHLKNFSSLTTDDYNDSGNERDRSVNHLYKNVNAYAHAADSAVTDSGYNQSQGFTTTINSASLQAKSGNVAGTFYVTRINKDSMNTAATFDEFKANNMQSANLGGLQMSNTENQEALQGDTYLPFCLAMYVDFSELTDESGAGDFFLGFKIHTLDSSGNPIAYFPGMGSVIGSQNWWRTYYVLNQSTGEWERVYFNANGTTAGVRYFPSKSIRNNADGNPISLAGYKGYIAIPMVHFKRGGTENQYLMNDATALNNIFSVEIVFGGQNGTGEKFANKSFTIDNIGFTYDPNYYTYKGKNISGRDDLTYAESFGAKSTKATEFETAVAAIDPYDTETLAEKIEAAKDIYGYPYRSEMQANALSQWQKDNITTVQQAKVLLDKYIAGDIPPAAMTVAELKAKLNDASFPNIPEKATTLNPLPNPGFVTDSSAPITPGEVNYAAFGFASKAQAEEIIKYYTDTYRRLSAADKAQLTEEERTQLLNAYNAAMRCAATLESVLENAVSFADELKTVYTRYTDGTQTLNLIKTTERQKIVALSENQYEALAYYAKTGLGDGTIIPAYAGMVDGLSRYLTNTNKITVDGEEIEGGVYKLMAQYTQLYKDVKTQLDQKATLSDELVAQLKETIAEYNDLIPAYKNIFELYYGSEQADASGEYQGIKDILDLFLNTDVAFEDGTKEADLALTEDNADTASQTLNVNYLEEYPVVTGGDSSTYFTLKYDGVLASGVTLRHYDLMLNGNKIPSVAYDAEGIQLTEAMLGDTLKNNTYTAENPFAMVFTAKITDTEPFAQQLSDKVTIVHYRPADLEKGETEPQVLGTYILNVTYTPNEAYTVSIPAEFPVDWGTAETDVSYSVDCVLKEGSKIAVNVVGAGQLTAVKDASLVMNYTAQDFAVTEFKGVQTAVKPTALPMVLIDETTWNTVPVGEYRDTLTYTVEYTSAP